MSLASEEIIATVEPLPAEETMENQKNCFSLLEELKKIKLNFIESYRDYQEKKRDSFIGNELNKMFYHRLIDLIGNIGQKAVIYGGFPRDIYIRQTAEQKYGEYISNECKKIADSEAMAHDMEQIAFLMFYSNDKVHPETFQKRNLFPRDLDMFILEEDYQTVIDNLKQEYQVNIEDCTASNYIDTEYKDLLLHYHITINLFGKIQPGFNSLLINLLKTSEQSVLQNAMRKFKIDCIIKKKYAEIKYKLPAKNEEEAIERDLFENQNKEKYANLYPPFNKPDFLCNQLVIVIDDKTEKKSLKRRNSHEFTFKINKVFMNFYEKSKKQSTNLTNRFMFELNTTKMVLNDAYNGIATALNDSIPVHRLMKMHSMKYKINFNELFDFYDTNYGNQKRKFLKASQQEEDICCICCICQGNFEEDIKNIIKPCKCNGYMHINCFVSYHKQFKSSSPNQSIIIVSCPLCREKRLHSDYDNFCKMMDGYYSGIGKSLFE